MFDLFIFYLILFIHHVYWLIGDLGFFFFEKKNLVLVGFGCGLDLVISCD